MEPFTEIQINRECVAPDDDGIGELAGILASVLESVGWPITCAVTNVGAPARLSVSAPAEAVREAADCVCPEWESEGQFSIIDVR